MLITSRPTAVVRLAHEHADSTHPRQRGGPWLFSEAMARAPWASVRSDIATEHEQAFRRAYAERLVEQGKALRVGRSRTSGPSGANTLTEVKLRGEQHEIERWGLAAKQLDVDRNSFLRRAANQFSDEVLEGECEK